jgi:hypothetical protein
MTLSVVRPVDFALLSPRCKNWEVGIFGGKDREEERKKETQKLPAHSKMDLEVHLGGPGTTWASMTK